MPLPNPNRNEVSLELGSHKFLARASFNFISQLEEYFNIPLTQVVYERLPTGQLYGKDLLVIFAAGIEAAKQEYSEDDLKDAIDEAGVEASIYEAIKLIMAAFKGPQTNTGKKKN